jgi:hypothetical protein
MVPEISNPPPKQWKDDANWRQMNFQERRDYMIQEARRYVKEMDFPCSLFYLDATSPRKRVKTRRRNKLFQIISTFLIF